MNQNCESALTFYRKVSNKGEPSYMYICFVRLSQADWQYYSVHSTFKILHFLFCCVPVAEDVSLAGGSAVQRIRLIDEEEQV